MKPIRSLCILLAAPAVAVAQLAPPAERIDDATIQRDHLAYERVQGRIRALHDAGRRVADRHLAKAQCWLDVSFHEYARNDRSDFPQAALAEGEKLVAALEAGGAPPADETPLLGAARLRADLWQRARALREGAGSACAAPRAGCAEVALVHAGHEHAQQGWRHARPYVQAAEEALDDAAAAAARCRPGAD